MEFPGRLKESESCFFKPRESLCETAKYRASKIRRFMPKHPPSIHWYGHHLNRKGK